jgi:hypothetical protein
MTAEIVSLEDYRRARKKLAQKNQIRGLGTVFGCLTRDQLFIVPERDGGHPDQIWMVGEGVAERVTHFGTVCATFPPNFPVELLAKASRPDT